MKAFTFFHDCQKCLWSVCFVHVCLQLAVALTLRSEWSAWENWLLHISVPSSALSTGYTEAHTHPHTHTYIHTHSSTRHSLSLSLCQTADGVNAAAVRILNILKVSAGMSPIATTALYLSSLTRCSVTSDLEDDWPPIRRISYFKNNIKTRFNTLRKDKLQIISRDCRIVQVGVRNILTVASINFTFPIWLYCLLCVIMSGCHSYSLFYWFSKTSKPAGGAIG